MKNYFYLFSVLIALFFSCSEKNPNSESIDPIQELEFEVVDSLIVDVLSELIVLDYNSGKDQYLMKERRGGGIFLIDGTSKIIAEPDLAGDGPNQISMIWEGKFFGAEHYIFKEMSATMDFHLYDSDFQKVETIPGAAIGLNAIFLSFYRQTFTVWEENGNPYLIGEEVNSYNPADVDSDKIGGDFYNQVKSGFFYDLNADSISYLNLYPNAWEPKESKRWIGQSFPYLAFNAQLQRAAVLPPFGRSAVFI